MYSIQVFNTVTAVEISVEVLVPGGALGVVQGWVIVVGHFLQAELERRKTVFQRELVLVPFDQVQSGNDEVELVT